MLRLIVALLLVPALLSTAQTPAAAPPNRLAFAWPAGLTGRVDINLMRQQILRGEGAPPVTWRTGYTFRTDAAPNGLRVRFIEPNAAEVTAGFKAGFGDDVTTMRPPSMLVDTSGKFVSVEDGAEYIASMQKFSAGLTPAPALTDAALTEGATRVWMGLVQSWIGTALDQSVIDAAATNFNPLGDVPARMFARVMRHRPCKRGTAALECVAFEARYRATEKSESTALLNLLIETGTMLPHRFDLTRDLDQSTASSDGTRTVRRLRTQLSQVFTYK